MSRRTAGLNAATGRGQAAVAQAVEFFISSIRDPHNPRHCGGCLLGAFVACTPAEHMDMASTNPSAKLKRSNSSVATHPELWDAVMKFLMLKRTDKQLERLLVRLSTCACSTEQNAGPGSRYCEDGKKLANAMKSKLGIVDELLVNHSGGPERRLICQQTYLGRAFILYVFLMFNIVVAERLRLKCAFSEFVPCLGPVYAEPLKSLWVTHDAARGIGLIQTWKAIKCRGKKLIYEYSRT